jgi:hypothetical protein
LAPPRLVNSVWVVEQGSRWFQTKGVSRNSEVIYLSINFEQGLVYARFLVYKTEKDWVVQNMDFSDRPEALMPWLAFEGQQTTE